MAVASALHDLDAITLSTARLVEQGQVEAGLGSRLLLAASLSNHVLNGAVAAALGKRRLWKWLALPYAATFLGGATLLLFWPLSG